MDFPSFTAVLSVLIAFLIGSLPFSYLIARWRAGVNIIERGEGNVGARNVYHVVGRSWGALAGVLDLTKGVAAFLVADQMSDSTTALLACGFAAPLGHSFSPFLRFRGGKGVATTVGFLFAYLPYSTGVGALILVIAYCLTRDMNKALVPGIVGMVALPPVFGAPLWVVLYVLCLFLMLAVKKAIDAPHERMVWARDPWSEGRPGFHRDEADAEAEEARSL